MHHDWPAAPTTYLQRSMSAGSSGITGIHPSEEAVDLLCKTLIEMLKYDWPLENVV